MLTNRVYIQTQLKMHISNILFFAINIFHIVLASTSNIVTQTDTFLKFRILFFSDFNLIRFLLALGIVLAQIFLSYLVLNRKFRKAELVLITESGLAGENNDKILQDLRLNPKQIYEWVHSMADEQNIKSIRRIYLTDTSIPNALTIDVLPLPLIRRSWIVLDANILEVLEEREIKAVISHELGHVKRFDGIVNLFRFGVNYLVFLAYAFLIVSIIYHIIADKPVVALDIALKIVYLLVVLFIIYIFTIINNLLINFSRRQSELVADYYSARTIGRNHIINALVLLGQRMDVISAFGAEFKWLGSLEGKENLTREFIQGLKTLPPKEITKKISREKAVSIYVSQRLKNIRDDLFVPLTNDQINKLTEVSSKKLLKVRENSVENGFAIHRQLKADIHKLTIDWLSIDKDKDLYLQDEEIDNLIKIIKRNPEKELFEEEIQKRRTIIGYDHPSIKQRILFLYEALENKSRSEDTS